MKDKSLIVIFDDEQRTRRTFEQKLSNILPRKQFEIQVLEEKDFTDALKILQERQSQFRREGTYDDAKRSILDDATFLILDFELISTVPFLKAEEVAYLARCFTTCGLILILNRFGTNNFDLNLNDPQLLSSFADLHIGQDQLDNKYLWGRKDTAKTIKIPTDFFPWQWPVLPEYAANFEKRIEDVAQAIEQNITIENQLKFPTGTFETLPRKIAQFIGENPSSMTFDKFVNTDSGFEHKDKVTEVNPTIVARIGAARISKWLEYSLIPEQDILVDAPHLVSRLPGLLSEKPSNIKAWNQTVLRKAPGELGVNAEIIEPFRFEKDYWASRPLWLWRKIMDYDKIEDVREPWNIQYPQWVFCEDASAFSTQSREFVSATFSAFSRRYLRFFDNVQYEPRNRLSL